MEHVRSTFNRAKPTDGDEKCESIKDLIYQIIIFLILHMIDVFADFL
jgi:hypothetical protein